MAVYLPKPPRGGLYPAIATAGLLGAGTGGGAGAAAAPSLARTQQLPLPLAPARSQLRGTWALSKGTATLTAALSEEGRGEFDLRVRGGRVVRAYVPAGSSTELCMRARRLRACRGRALFLRGRRKGGRRHGRRPCLRDPSACDLAPATSATSQRPSHLRARAAPTAPARRSHLRCIHARVCRSNWTAPRCGTRTCSGAPPP